MSSGFWISTVLAGLLAGSTGNVTTQRVDNARTGAVLSETVLTPASVPGHLQRVYERRLDGQTLANPLYVEGVQVTPSSKKNLFFMATAKNCVYAFDLADHTPDSVPAVPADHCDTSTRAVWHREVGATAGVTICAETRPPRVGVTSTPVIDPASNAIFLVSFHSDDHQHYLHKMDLRTGADLHAPVRIGGKASGVTFDAACQRNRPGLLLQKGIVYVAFGTFGCDVSCPSAPYRGWIFGYRAGDLAAVSAFTAAPTGGGAGIWQSGNGLVGDGSSIYFETGNDLALAPLGDSFVRVDVSGSRLSVHGSFSPANRGHLRAADTDLGSGGPVLLPGGKLLGGGKEGKLYLVDIGMRRTADQEWLAFRNTWHDDPNQPLCDLTYFGPLPANGCFMPHDRYQDSEHWGPNIHGGPVYWKSAAAKSFGYVYLLPEKEYLRQLRYNLRTLKVETAPFHSSTERTPDGMPGGAISLSADGDRNGIVWALIPNADAQMATAPGHLVAYRADLLTELWRDDDPVAFAKFNPPLAVAGHVIRPTFADRVIVYALGAGQAAGTPGFRPQPVQPAREGRPGPVPAPLPCYSIDDKAQALGGSSGTLGRAVSEAIDLAGSAGGKVRYFEGAEPLGGACDTPADLKFSPVPTAIYWSAKTCAHLLRGGALALWESLGAEAGTLGYPLTDEVPTRDGAGRRIVFEQGEIRWTPAEGYTVLAP
jgi:hypothetical protein